jgi:Mrp family chromosome partitioning ATPase
MGEFMSESDVKNAGSECSSCGRTECSAKQLGEDETLEQWEERVAVQKRLCRIQNRIVVLSGKGGVGKSTVAVNLAIGLAMNGKATGLLDIDLHGPSIPTMLKLAGVPIQTSESGMEPVRFGALRIMSIGFLLKKPDDAVIWRGPRKAGVIRQFIRDVNWGDLDYLIVDCPPGTGDEPLAVCQAIGNPTGAIVVTTPQEVAAADVRKSLNFCRELALPILGMVENMSGFVCPHCGKNSEIFHGTAGETLSKAFGVPLLGRIPIDPRVAESCDEGHPLLHRYADSPAAKAYAPILDALLSLSPLSGSSNQTS